MFCGEITTKIFIISKCSNFRNGIASFNCEGIINKCKNIKNINLHMCLHVNSGLIQILGGKQNLHDGLRKCLYMEHAPF